MDEALIDLQTKVAFQDETIAELNEVLSAQQRQLDELRAELRLLREACQELLDALERPPAEERPPHY